MLHWNSVDTYPLLKAVWWPVDVCYWLSLLVGFFSLTFAPHLTLLIFIEGFFVKLNAYYLFVLWKSFASLVKIKQLKVVLFTCAIQIKFTFGNMPYIKQVFLVCLLNSHELFDGRMSVCNKFCDLQMPFQEVDATLQPFQLHVCGSFNLITLKNSYMC